MPSRILSGTTLRSTSTTRFRKEMPRRAAKSCAGSASA